MEWPGKSFLRRWHFSWDLHIKEKPDIQRWGDRIGRALMQDWAEHGGTERKWEWLGIMIKEMGPEMWAEARIKLKKKPSQLWSSIVSSLRYIVIFSCLWFLFISLKHILLPSVFKEPPHPSGYHSTSSLPAKFLQGRAHTRFVCSWPTHWLCSHSNWTLLLTEILLMPPTFSKAHLSFAPWLPRPLA